MKIGELASQTDVSIHTIRFYEKQGLLQGTTLARSENNYRRYSEDAVQRIFLIKQAQAAGFSLSEIKPVLLAWMAGKLNKEEKLVIFREKIEEVDERIQELQDMRDYLKQKVTAIESDKELELSSLKSS